MKYIESEYKIINLTPCEFCGGKYLPNEQELHIIEDEPFNICECVCEKCGSVKDFVFFAPFFMELEPEDYNSELN
jgi:hypothetical protein